MRKVLSFTLLILAFLIKAQEKPSEGQITVSDTVKHWSIQGQNTLMLNQSCIFPLGCGWCKQYRVDRRHKLQHDL